MKTCRKAPKGWKCTREHEHEGPCAAVKVPWYSQVFNVLGQALFGGKRCLILALLLLPVTTLAQTASNQYKTIKIGWIAPIVGGAVYPACNFPTVTTACVNGYQGVFTAPSTAGGGTNTVPPCTATLISSCIPWGVSNYSWSPGGFLYVGNWGISLSTAYLDPNGVQQFTVPLLGSVSVPNPSNPPSPATGLNVTLAP